MFTKFRSPRTALTLIVAPLTIAAPAAETSPKAPQPAKIVSTQPAAHSHTNRLAREKSPYLLQHQHNPVDWFAWGDEAFKKAREIGRAHV